MNKLTKQIYGAVLSLAVAFSPATVFAQAGTSAAATPAAATATTTTPVQSDPGGLGTAYNFSVPNGASSTCCGRTYDHKHANNNAQIMMRNTNQKLAAMQLAIIESLRLGVGQLSGNLREGVGAEHTLADQVDDRAVVRAVEEARYKAMDDAVSGTTSCYAITGTSGGNLQGAVNKSAVAYSGELDKWIRGETEFSNKGQEAAQFYRLEAYCKSYGTEADVKAKLCDTRGNLPAASVNASESLFYRGDSGVDYTFTQERAEATNAFLLNAFAPTTFTPLSEAEAQSPEGRKKAARYKTQMARDSIGRHVAVEYAKGFDPQSASPGLASWAKDRVKNMQGMENVNVDKLSKQQWLAIYAKGFLLDTDKLTAGDQTPTTAIKDMKNMMAVMNFVLMEQLEQQQKMNVQLALQNVLLNEKTRTDGIFTSASQ